VVFRRSAVAAVGGYEDVPLAEDYWLWVRLLRAGADLRNVAEPLVGYRVSAGAYERRGGMRMFRADLALQANEFLDEVDDALKARRMTGAGRKPAAIKKKPAPKKKALARKKSSSKKLSTSTGKKATTKKATTKKATKKKSAAKKVVRKR
jgi:hypothetical protein